LPISFTNASLFFCLWGWLPASVLLPLFFSWSLLSTRYRSLRERRLAVFFFGGMPAGSAYIYIYSIYIYIHIQIYTYIYVVHMYGYV
jgi:hypothetical protein